MSETSTRMYNSVLDAQDKLKDLDETMKEVNIELRELNKKKEAAEGRKREAIKKHTELELDVRDIEEKMSGNIRAKVYIVHLQKLFSSVGSPFLPVHLIYQISLTLWTPMNAANICLYDVHPG